jgi:WD40 repeat protein
MKLKQIKSIKAHNDIITSLSIFPISENIISVGYENDKSIKIWNKDFILIQNIEKAHETSISDIDIKDENNFATSCWFSTINIWNKNEKDNKFYLKETIKAHLYHTWISKIIFKLNGTLISCGQDKTIRIWEICNNKYQCVTILTHNESLYSILLLEDKNILVTSGLDGTIFWDNKFFYFICFFDAISWGNHSLKRINDDKIIVGGKKDHLMKVISISEKKIIYSIDNTFDCYGICVILEKGIFLTVGQSHNIRIYDCKNYKFIEEINNAHNNEICGMVQLKNKLIFSFSYDNFINVWSFI